jgi:NifU-like protein involved in Fe-S cluster formation
MASDLDSFVESMQQRCNELAEEKFGPVAGERWRNPRHAEPLQGPPDAVGTSRGGCGDTISICLALDGDGRIAQAAFDTNGCGSSAVCGDAACELAVGKTPAEAARVSGADILELLGGLPEDKEHCAMLAANALHETLKTIGG